MIHFQTRSHIIGWLEQNCIRKTIQRAIAEGKVEFLGGFSQVPPRNLPGWMMRVRSIYGKTWFVAVVAYRHRPKYGIHVLEKIPWEYWIGDESDNPMFKGDNPDGYRHKRRLLNAEN